MSDKPARENPRQHAAFLAYSGMPDFSAQKMWETWEKHGQLKKYRRPALRTLEDWCTRYDWVVRAEEIHWRVKQEATKKLLEELIMSKEEILKITRAIMIRYALQLKDNAHAIKTTDFKIAWEIQRIESGLPTTIGKQQVKIEDEYEGVPDEVLLKKLNSLAAVYRDRINKPKKKK